MKIVVLDDDQRVARTLGVLGLGRLGTRVARIGRAFDMRVLAWSQNRTPERAAEAGATRVPGPELLAASDVVTVPRGGYRSMYEQVVEDITAWRAGTPVRVLAG